MDEVYEVFVESAPFRDERELIFRALSVYLDIIRSRHSPARVLLNGGFVTHKTWAAPHDADVAIGLDTRDYKSTFEPDNISSWTLQGIQFAKPQPGTLNKVQPMLGLVDGYFFPSALPNFVHFWEDQWGKVKDEFGNEAVGIRKGYLEMSW